MSPQQLSAGGAPARRGKLWIGDLFPSDPPASPGPKCLCPSHFVVASTSLTVPKASLWNRRLSGFNMRSSSFCWFPCWANINLKGRNSNSSPWLSFTDTLVAEGTSVTSYAAQRETESAAVTGPREVIESDSRSWLFWFTFPHAPRASPLSCSPGLIALALLLPHWEKPFERLERWLRAYEHTLLYLRTQVRFYSHIRWLTTARHPTPRDLTPLTCVGTCICEHIPPLLTHIIKIIKNESFKFSWHRPSILSAFVPILPFLSAAALSSLHPSLHRPNF